MLEISNIRKAYKSCFDHKPVLHDSELPTFLRHPGMAKCGQKQTSKLKKKAVRRLIASHPVYQYLTRRYSLNLKSILWEPDALPAESEWQNLAERRERHPASWMLWKAEPVAESRERLQQLGVQSAVFDPCAKPAGSG